MDSTPIEPPPLLKPSRHARDPVLEEISRLHFLPRLLVAIAMAIVAILFGSSAVMLGSIGHWTIHVFVLLVMEPIALFLLCGAVYFVAPRSPLGRVFEFTLRRAKPVLVVFLVLFNVLVIGSLAWALVLYLLSRR